MTDYERNMSELDLVISLPEFEVEQLASPLTDEEVEAILDAQETNHG